MHISNIHLDMTSVYQMNSNSGLSVEPKVNSAETQRDEDQDTEPATAEVSTETDATQPQGSSEQTSFIDAAIEQIKKQIEAIEAQLQKLESIGGEAALAQKKVLNEQLLTLNARLMELMAEKANQLKGA